MSWNQVVAQTEGSNYRSAGWHSGHLVKGVCKVEGERWRWEKPSVQQEEPQANILSGAAGSVLREEGARKDPTHLGGFSRVQARGHAALAGQAETSV